MHEPWGKKILNERRGTQKTTYYMILFMGMSIKVTANNWLLGGGSGNFCMGKRKLCDIMEMLYIWFLELIVQLDKIAKNETTCTIG